MAFNVNELNVIRSFIAVTGEAPTQAQLAAAMGASSLTAAIREAGIVDTTTPRTAFTEGLYANAGMTADQEGVNYWRGEVSDLGHVRAVAEFQWAAQADAAFVAKVEAATTTLQPTGQDFTQDEDGDDGDGPGLDFDFNVEFSTKEATTGHNTLHSDTSDTVFNLGRDVLDAGQSAITNDYTITLKDQLGTAGMIGDTSVATYNAYFLSPIIEATAGQNLGGQLFVRIVDMQAPVNAVDQGLDNVRISAVSFDLNDKRVNLVVDPAKIDTYEDFVAELNAALEAEKANNPDLNNVTISLGDTFTRQRFDANEQPVAGEVVTGRDVVIKTSSGTLVAGANNATTAGSTGVISQGQSAEDLGAVAGSIQTNLVLDNVGYGSQGGSVNVSGQSASNKGIDIFNVEAKNGVWLSALTSSPRDSTDQMLKTINLTGTGYFKVGEQVGGTTNVLFGENGAGNFVGLTDVREFNAGGFNGEIQLNAQITDAIIERDLNLSDTGNNPATDNLSVKYHLGNGNNKLNLVVADEVATREDIKVDINMGGGNNHVQIQADQSIATGNLLNNLQVRSGSGNDRVEIVTVAGEHAGKFNIHTGNGNDTVYINGQSDATAETGSWNISTATGAATFVDRVMYKAQLTVSFAGFESKVEVPTGPNFVVTQFHINQAIKKAIADNNELKQLLEAKDGTGSQLIIESTVDGANELAITLAQPEVVANGATATQVNLVASDATALKAGLVQTGVATNSDAADPLLGAAADTLLAADAGSSADATTTLNQSIINVGGGNNNLIVLASNDDSANTIVIDQKFGKVSVVNFFDDAARTEVGDHKLDFTAYLTTQTRDAASTSEASKVTVDATVQTGAAAVVNGVHILTFNQGGTTDTFANLSETVLRSALNTGGTDFGNLETTSLTTGAALTDIVGGTRDHILMVQNGANLGEYKVFHLQSTETAGVVADDFSKVELIGTLDFGNTLVTGGTNFVDANLV